jgi:hypothetical protein
MDSCGLTICVQIRSQGLFRSLRAVILPALQVEHRHVHDIGEGNQQYQSRKNSDL